ncbi:hypothetical protein [Chamaesiphon sp. VAR_69_metabat_338]|nr:hypothetical protein [Chamaesiphon sp. VAR_69_metabat_338]
MVGEQRREQAANGVAVPTAGYANANVGKADGCDRDRGTPTSYL